MPLYEFAGERPRIGEETFVHPRAVLIGNVTVGRECFIGPGAVIRADFGPITVGSGSSVQDNAVLHVTPGDEVRIHDRVIVGHGAILHDVKLHEGCTIGMGAILLQRAVCEEFSLVAAGSLVPQGMTIPARMMAAGSPARIVKEVPADLAAFIVMGVDEYRNLTRRYLETFREVAPEPEISGRG
ncbi:MAG TPA: gamma carbonic anhydrase family protein [Syntrophales bacterium]|nr:gamma carbonic anhydrase family protein [Syntrophales bacterium]